MRSTETIRLLYTNEFRELPAIIQIFIFSCTVLLSVVGSIPLLGIIYGCVRKTRLLREMEERRRRRIDALLGETVPVANPPPWQVAIRLIPNEQAENILSRLMHTFTWIQKESKVDNKLSESLDDNAYTEEGNADYCAICLSHFEDQEEVVQSSINVCIEVDMKANASNITNLCVHRFHKSCMIEWLLRSKEPICPICRREYLDRGRMEEEGLVIEGNSQEGLREEAIVDENSDITFQNEHSNGSEEQRIVHST